MMFVENLWTSKVSTLEYSRFFLTSLSLFFAKCKWKNIPIHFYVSCPNMIPPPPSMINKFWCQGMGDWWRSPWKVWDLQSWRVQLDISGDPIFSLQGNTKSRWWFQIFFMFTLPGEDSQFDYFSNGLKPPTRNDVWWSWCMIFWIKQKLLDYMPLFSRGTVYTWYRSRRYRCLKQHVTCLWERYQIKYFGLTREIYSFEVNVAGVHIIQESFLTQATLKVWRWFSAIFLFFSAEIC